MDVNMNSKKVKYILFLFGLIVVLNLSACAPVQRETMTQVSTLQALMNGLYDGKFTLGEVAKYGDFGLGTVDKLDGEMIILDGNFYQVTYDGKVHVLDSNTLTPFAEITFFDKDRLIRMPAGTNYEGFNKLLDSELISPNVFYAIRAEGLFKSVKTRSVPKQTPPYPILAEVTKKQAVFDLNNIEGTIVGYRCPEYLQGINAAGYHLHFISKDKNAGGHVLAFETGDVQVSIDQTAEFKMILPEDEVFYNADLQPQTEGE